MCVCVLKLQLVFRNLKKKQNKRKQPGFVQVWSLDRRDEICYLLKEQNIDAVCLSLMEMHVLFIFILELIL